MTKREWIDSLVEKRRKSGVWSQSELEGYRAELTQRFRHLTEKQFQDTAAARRKS
jgi:hypothetical protein